MKRLTYEDYIVTKDRVATPSYPKDMGTISLMLDLKSGDRGASLSEFIGRFTNTST